jgi:hypothetical protein
MRGRVTHLAVSPDGRLLAGLDGAGSGSSDSPTRVFVLRARDGHVRAERELGRGVPGEFRWVSDNRLLLTRRPSGLLYDADLARKAKLSWSGVSSVAIGCRLFGTGFGVVARSSVCAETGTRVIREFFSPITYALTKLPRGTEIDAPPRN